MAKILTIDEIQATVFHRPWSHGWEVNCQYCAKKIGGQTLLFTTTDGAGSFTLNLVHEQCAVTHRHEIGPKWAKALQTSFCKRDLKSCTCPSHILFAKGCQFLTHT